MPIIGVTDRQSITPRLPRLGKLRKGGQREKKVSRNGKEYESYGQDLNYFRFTSDRPEIVAAFREAYGEQPAAIPVYLPYPTVDENFPTWQEKWIAGGLVHRCDGRTMTIWLGDDKHYHREPKPCPYHGLQQTEDEKKKDPPCDGVGRLELILPQLWLAGFVGYVTLETHSINDMIAITSALEDAYARRDDVGQDLTGMEFMLRRVKEKISTPGWGENATRQRVEKWLVVIEPSASWMHLQLEAKRSQAELMLGSGLVRQAPALPADPATGEFLDHIDAEFSSPDQEEQGDTDSGEIEAQASAPETQAGLPADACSDCGQSGGYHASTCKAWQKQNLAGAGKNGGKATTEKPKKSALLLSEAAALKTPNGSLLGGLTVQQLEVVRDKGDADLQAAANRLLGKVTADDLKKWNQLVKIAEEVQLFPLPATPDTTGIELWTRIEGLKLEIDQAKADKLAADLLKA